MSINSQNRKYQLTGEALYEALESHGYEDVDEFVSLIIEHVELDGIKALRKPFHFVHGSVRDLEEIFPMCTFEDADLAACTKLMGLEVEDVNGDLFYPAAVWKQLYGLQQTDTGLAILPL
jgi:hypothetical protein